jgi:hypothetical protein
MKKIFALLVCTILLLCAFPVSVFAEGESVGSVEPTVEVVDTLSTTEEIATEGEILTEKTIPDITPELIVEYIKVHFEEISVIITLILTVFYNIRKHKLLNRSIAATNNNAITVAENSDIAIRDALSRMEGISSDVLGYKEAFALLLAEYRANAEEKKKLESTLNEAMTCIKASKLANVEFANELAELLVLANIPNSKKEELYSRHLAAVGAIADAEKMEVNTDGNGQET